jgi:outer membrane protein assembly factor BamB
VPVSFPGTATAEDLYDLDPADPVDAEIISVLENWANLDPADPLDRTNPADLQLMIATGILDNVNAVLSSTALLALDPASGAELWRMPMDPAWGDFSSVTTVVPDAGGTTIAVVVESNDVEADGSLQGDSTSRAVVADAATGHRRWETEIARGPSLLTRYDDRIAMVDGTVVVDQDERVTAYPDQGRELWSQPVSTPDRHGSQMERLVATGDRLFQVGRDVWEIDLRDGGRRLVREGANAGDVTVVGDDLLVIAGSGALEAHPLE